MLPLLPTTTALLEQTAIFAERRQDVLAGNIANISTPRYRARDLPVTEFQEALKKAWQTRPQGSIAPADPQQPVPKAPGPWTSQGTLELDATLFQSAERPQTGEATFQDAGHRSIEQEVLELTKNSMMQSFALEVLSAQLHQFEMIINERPS